MDALRHDILYALRVLRKDRTYAVAVILTLAVAWEPTRDLHRRQVGAPAAAALPGAGSSGLLLRQLPGGWSRSGRTFGSELRGQTGDEEVFASGALYQWRGYKVAKARAPKASRR